MLPPRARRLFHLTLRRDADHRAEQRRQDLDEEIRLHLELRVEQLVARGTPPDEARQRALAKFGPLVEARQRLDAAHRHREDRVHLRERFDELAQDLRYGVRSLRRAPLFTLLAVVTLAVGIGANAAVFGVVKSVLLGALPYADADGIMRVYARWNNGTNDRGPFSAAMVQDFRERNRSFAQLAAFEGIPRDAVFSDDAAPHAVKVAWTEPALFEILGVPASHGRVLLEDDAAADTAWNVVVTHAAWQRLLGGDPAVVGRTVRVNGITRTVVGVLPKRFVGPIGEVDFYFPMHLRGALRDPVRARSRSYLGLMGRLRPGVSADAGHRDLAVIGTDLAREHPDTDAYLSVVAMPVRTALLGDTRTPLLVLMASAGLVLAIACANLAGAMLSRALSRRKEFAVRASLGATHGRLVRQLLTESSLLALAGGAAGVLLALGGLRAVRGLALLALPPYADLALDRGALLFTAVVAIASGLAFGLAPALSVRRSDVQRTLRDETRGSTEGHRARSLRGVLVAGQIALCITLLASAGLLARSLWAMAATPLGFAPDGVLAAAVQLPPGQPYNDAAARVRFIEQFEAQLRALPGVTAVATTGELPTRTLNRNGFTVEGATPAPADAPNSALFETVSDDYFRALGIPLRAGRAFGPQDAADGQPVVIVSEGLARRHWPEGKAVGGRLRFGSDAPWLEVVGVVGDVANDPTRLQPYPATYLPMRQSPWIGPIFLLRTAGDPAALSESVRRALAVQDPHVPLHHATPMRALIAEGFSARQLPVLLMTAFGVLALLLASVGVYAMFAELTAAREREFGVRVALGASRAGIARLVLQQGAGWMAAGLFGGAVGVLLAARVIRGLLYGVTPFDQLTLGITVALPLACATIALLPPVRRATRVDPITVLR